MERRKELTLDGEMLLWDALPPSRRWESTDTDPKDGPKSEYLSNSSRLHSV